ncbi:hypothetical protein OG548_08115 [Streptomyces sp. NBC_01356]|uniref:hypothetical protein n=1 Tax=Streptomyces sp. NBC_01356 TaxID=2903836 RepID=UPI002E337BD8|nr:hypothetical protein [Streptomyces sp. NBC_01356]
MAQFDPSIADLTPTDAVADRADVYRIAAKLIGEAGLITDADPEDVLVLAQFLAGNDI